MQIASASKKNSQLASVLRIISAKMHRFDRGTLALREPELPTVVRLVLRCELAIELILLPSRYFIVQTAHIRNR